MATRSLVPGRAVVNDLDVLRRIVKNLLHEVERSTYRVHIDSDNGVDFYEAVERFEAELIRSALAISGGRQNRAASLLKLRNSTLSAKMKQLKMR
jgi:DNA-binding NtrC family response regulator